MAVADELARGEYGGNELRPIGDGIEPALEQPDHVRAGIAPHANGFGVNAAELPLGNVAVVAAQLLLGAQLYAIVRELAFAALAVLAGTIFAAVDGALRAAPDILAHAAVDLVFRLVALGHRVLCLCFLEDRALLCPGVAGTDRPWPKRRARPRVAKRRAGRPRGAAYLGAKQGQVNGRRSAPSLDLLIDIDFDRAGKQRAPRLHRGLHARVAGDALAVELDQLMGFIFDLVNEAGGIVDVLHKPHAARAKRLVERRRRFHQRGELGGICARQREFELYRSSHLL